MNEAANLLTMIFGAQGDINWAQMCARSVLILIYGLTIVRIAGRRLFGKWSALDIVVSVIIASNLSRALTANAPLAATLAATSLLVCMHWLLAHAAARHAGLARFLEGRGIKLAENGGVDQRKLHTQAVSASDLSEALRQGGVEDVTQTKLVMLEPSGRITILKT